MADIAIPDPVAITLELLRNCRVSGIRGSQLCMGAVMARLTVYPAAHTLRRIH